jgi:hypothetical protein
LGGGGGVGVRACVVFHGGAAFVTDAEEAEVNSSGGSGVGGSNI